ncbi:AAA family ATPase [Thermoflavimicrobium dichotomicum]|uniref:Pilus assembly protein CpaE n=1 Tax=Thermoflavimicrobium dichotomicum TaxID=46223 RepID=A0A1I3QQH5_9BACL|nr:AAA family ATPase [Thermoflavimicrobium dichotomicum]SFJ36384.1 pilus assembly protein CpaE [Thermoflavimicrobium dichotomicum]
MKLSMNSDIKVLVISEDSLSVSDVTERVKRLFSQVLHLSFSEVKREISRIQPHLVLLYEGNDNACISYIAYILKEVQRVAIVYITESKDFRRVRDANRAGVFDVLFFPEEINLLEDVMMRAAQSLQVDQEKEGIWGRGKVIAIYSGKGGTGKSLIASTLAQTLQLDTYFSVLLVDLNLQYGGIETFLNLQAGRHIYDLTPVLNELNDNHIRNVTVAEPHSQLEVLVSPIHAEIGEQVTEIHVERLLRTARLYYDYILVDLPSAMNELTYTTLEEADQIYYILTPDLLSLKVLHEALTLFAYIGVDLTNRFRIVMNRKKGDAKVKSREVYDRFGYPVVSELRDDEKKVQSFIHRGELLRKERQEKGLCVFARDIQKLAQIILNDE